MLRPGGTMVYSTCTFNDTENEGVPGVFWRCTWNLRSTVRPAGSA